MYSFFLDLDLNLLGLALAQREVVPLDQELNGGTQGGYAHDLDLGPTYYAHIEDATAHRPLASYFDDGCPFTGLELIQRSDSHFL